MTTLGGSGGTISLTLAASRRQKEVLMPTLPRIDVEQLRTAIRDEYAEVATHPDKGFHFHTGRRLAALLGYPAELIDPIPVEAVESFAGVGNPFVLGPLLPGESVLDAGSGAGLDSLIAARMVGAAGSVVGVDMTPSMLERARRAARGSTNVEFREGYLESLPVADESIDVVISNGVTNLVLNKPRVYRELYRVLKPGGRIQLADIVVQKEVPAAAKEDIGLWTG